MQKSKKGFSSFAYCLMASLVFFLLPIAAMAEEKSKENHLNHCERLVSLAPSVTEMIDYIGLADRLVGITTYCKRPKDAKKAQTIGGLLDMNVEAVYALQPDLIISGENQSPNLQRVQQLNMNVLLIKQNSLQGLIEGFDQIAQACGLSSEVTEKKNSFITHLEKFKQRLDVLYAEKTPKVLLIYGSPKDGEMLMAAGVSYHSDLLSFLGFENAYQGALNAPNLSAEGLLGLDPEIIVYLQDVSTPILSDFEEEGSILPLKVEISTKTPSYFKKLSAYKNDQIYEIKGNFTTVPAPESTMKLAEALVEMGQMYFEEVKMYE